MAELLDAYGGSRGTRRQRDARHRSIPHTTRHLGSELTEDSTRTTHEGSPFPPPAFSFSVHTTMAFLLPSSTRNQRKKAGSPNGRRTRERARDRPSENREESLNHLAIKRAREVAIKARYAREPARYEIALVTLTSGRKRDFLPDRAGTLFAETCNQFPLAR